MESMKSLINEESFVSLSWERSGDQHTCHAGSDIYLLKHLSQDMDGKPPRRIPEQSKTLYTMKIPYFLVWYFKWNCQTSTKLSVLASNDIPNIVESQ